MIRITQHLLSYKVRAIFAVYPLIFTILFFAGIFSTAQCCSGKHYWAHLISGLRYYRYCYLVVCVSVCVMCAFTCACMRGCIYVRVYVCLCVCMCASMCTSMCACVFVYMVNDAERERYDCELEHRLSAEVLYDAEQLVKRLQRQWKRSIAKSR